MMMKKISVRKAYGEALADYGTINPKVVVVVADVSSSVFTSIFADRFPKRFFNVGITEQSMIDVAAGLALGGMIPFANTFATLFLRALEQIRTCVAYAKTNVKIVGGYSGLSDFKDGPSHHTEADVAIMRSLPNMTVLEAADACEVKKMVPLVAEYDGPVYLRISRAEMPALFDDSHEVEIGKSSIVQDGNDVTFIASGMMVSRCLEASKILAEKAVKARLINMYSIKPLDVSAIEKAAEETGAIVTAEEHSVIGGLGGAVAETLGNNYIVPIERVGIADVFTETALSHDELLDCYGMGVGSIVEAALHVIKRKKR
jgi:transketolase